jgi:flagellar assembly protein FliH
MTTHPTPLPAAAGVRKFQFDDFDMEADGLAGGLAVQQVFSLTEMAEARERTEAEAHAAGYAEAQASLEADAARALASALEQAAALRESQIRRNDAVASEAVRLAMLVARRVLPAFAESQAAREVEALIAACFKERPEEARLVIRVADALFDPIRARMEKLAAESGLAGAPVLLADPSLGLAEARVEWANGGADWDFEGRLADIEASARRLAARPAKAVEARAIPGDIIDIPPSENLPREETLKESPA